jgi:hypothetical protein
MKKFLIPTLTVMFLLSGCNQKPAETVAPAATAAARHELTPANVTNETWQNGILIEKKGLNGFFVTGEVASIAPAIGAHLTFAKSGDRVITDVVVTAPYVNIYVDKPLDPVGDGYPNKVR